MTCIMLPFDAEHLTEPEQAVQLHQERRNCWTCMYLRRHPKSGYYGCENRHDAQAVIHGDRKCPDYEEK